MTLEEKALVRVSTHLEQARSDLVKITDKRVSVSTLDELMDKVRTLTKQVLDSEHIAAKALTEMTALRSSSDGVRILAL